MVNLLRFQAELRNPIPVSALALAVFLSGIVALDANAQALSSSTDYQLTPFKLFYLAYQGHFKQDGIDSGNQAGNIDPKTLVQAAIKHDWLPEQAISNQIYLHELSVVVSGFNIDS